MPSKTEKQRKLMALAKTDPGKVFKRNRAVTKMSSSKLGDFMRKSQPKGK